MKEASMKGVPVQLVCMLLSGCISVAVVTVDKKSALEAQFIGEYEELSDDLVTMASVRATVNGFGVDGSDPYARALQARRLQAFYKDDLEAARKAGCVGELLDGHVKPLACADAKTTRVAAIENAAREALVDYAVAKNAQLSDADRAAVWQAYRRVVLASLAPGSMVQNAQGQWAAHAK